jgi:hypothetical protein
MFVRVWHSESWVYPDMRRGGTLRHSYSPNINHVARVPRIVQPWLMLPCGRQMIELLEHAMLVH